MSITVFIRAMCWRVIYACKWHTLRKIISSKLTIAKPEKIRKLTNWRPKREDLALIIKTALEWEKRL